MESAMSGGRDQDPAQAAAKGLLEHLEAALIRAEDLATLSERRTVERDTAQAALGRLVPVLREARAWFGHVGTDALRARIDDILGDANIAAAEDGWRELSGAINRALASEGDGTKAYASAEEASAFYRALQDLRIAWRKFGGGR
jgi:hypothetical protein